MELAKKYVDFAVEKTVELLNIDSPTGFTKKAAAWVKETFESLGCKAEITNKGAVLVTFDAPEVPSEEGAVIFEAHTDTLGAMVAEIKPDGRIRATNVGGLTAANVETEDVKIYTRDGRVYEGTFQLIDASLHVNRDFSSIERSFNTIEVVIDEKVFSKEDVKNLGISVGDYICPNPRAHVTSSGYIKSRFLDDKLSVGILIGFAKFLQEEKIRLKRQAYALITVYEEVGHGGAANIPADVTEAISVDMGCVGSGLECQEHQVSICAKDSGGPYDYEVTGKLIEAAKREGADYAVDVYPMYGSDVEVTLRAGYDVKHGLIGSGVYASHGYERSHVDGVEASIKVLKGYLMV